MRRKIILLIPSMGVIAFRTIGVKRTHKQAGRDN